MDPQHHGTRINPGGQQDSDHGVGKSSDLPSEISDLCLPGSNPWLSIWTRPRETIQQIIDSNPTKHVETLAVIGGISFGINRASNLSKGDDMPWTLALFIAIVLGAVGGIIELYLNAAVLRWTGSWIGGRATSEHLRAALAWSNVPYAFILAALLFIVVLLGEEMFTSKTPRLDNSLVLLGAVSVASFAAIAIWIWHLIIMMKSIAQVHGYSAWMAVVNWLLLWTVFVVPIAIAILLSRTLAVS